MKIIFPFFFSACILSCTLPTFHFKKIETSVESSFRGLSVVNDQVAWVSGNKGWVGITEDGGSTWNLNQVPCFEESDFRSLYAFDNQRAVIANAGAPANILVTSNAGVTWDTVYTNAHPDSFFDGMDFWNDSEGIIYGDPIEGKMLLLRTSDGGKHWTAIEDSPILSDGEASFAASGTGIRCIGESKVIISTGGMVSRLWTSSDKGEHWEFTRPPIVQGGPATGIYSFAQDLETVILAGGDYTNDTLASKHNLYSIDNGNNWLTPANTARGYRECVEFITNEIVVTTGPTGTDISYDRGKNWKPFSEDKGFHVVRKARNGTLTLIAGSNGQISVLEKN